MNNKKRRYYGLVVLLCISLLAGCRTKQSQIATVDEPAAVQETDGMPETDGVQGTDGMQGTDGRQETDEPDEAEEQKDVQPEADQTQAAPEKADGESGEVNRETADRETSDQEAADQEAADQEAADQEAADQTEEKGTEVQPAPAAPPTQSEDRTQKEEMQPGKLTEKPEKPTKEPEQPEEATQPEEPEKPELTEKPTEEPEQPEEPEEPELTEAEQIELAARKATMQPTLAYIGSIIDYYYLEKVDQEELLQKTLDQVKMDTGMEDAIKLMVAGLEDPYSAYYTAAEYQNVVDSNTGNYCGIGATIQKDEKTGGIRIVEPFSGGPAKKAGLKVNDIILKIDGMDVTDMDLDMAVNYVKGEQGTSVELELLRGKKKLTITVVRDFVTVETVTWRMEEEGIGYIRISQFEEVTVEQFNTAVEELEEAGMQSLVIDLRNNPGGLLSSVTQILERILPEGKLVTYTEDKYGSRENLYTSAADQLDIPMVVLVNGNSASASELFTGAVKDYEVATIVGENTFGKGIVQGFLQFTDGSSLKLTISKYYTPNGICIHKTGILPDFVVEQDPEQKEDEQLKLALELLQ